MLKANLLGPPEVSIEGSPVQVDTRKAIALLAYLAVERSATRDTVAALLWSESSSERARATFRRTLSALRSAVGSEVLDVDRHRVAITDQAMVDIWEFEKSTQAISNHPHDNTSGCVECISLLQRASAAYRGDFLEGFSVRDSPEFEDWVRTVGESYRVRAGDVFERLAMAQSTVGDYQAAIGAVGRWLSLDPLHEPAYRHLMLLKAWAGDRPGSIEVFRRCVAILDHELGVSPLEETTELYEAILDEDLPPAPGPRRRLSARATAPLGSESLIDREMELGYLNQVLASVADRGRVVGISGMSWMGKTRLVEEFVESLTEQETMSVIGRASRSEQGLPYGVVVQVLRGLIPHLTETLPEWARAELARLIPDLRRGDDPAASSDRFGELRLFHAVETLIGELCRDRILVVAVDDAHWLDPSSASLLSYLSKRTATLSMLLVLVYPPNQDRAEPLADLLAELEAVVELNPLTADELKRVTGTTEEAEALADETAGLPFLVSEHLAGDRVSGRESPGVIEYMKSRLRNLSGLARQVLGAAAVLGGQCHASLLREVSGRGDEEIVDAIEELVAVGLLRELPNSEDLRFTLEALEKFTYDSMSLIRRRLLHRRVATALAARPRASTDPQTAAAVAAQFEAAGSPEAADWYRRAGDLAFDLHAYSEAENSYETAIALGIPDIGQLRLRVGEVAMATGDYASAMLNLNGAAALLDAEALGLVEHRLGEVQRLLGRFDLAEEHFSRAAEAHPTPAALFADWALLRHRTGDDPGALELAQRSLRLAEEAGDDGQRSRAHNILGVVASDHRFALRSVDEALRLAGDDDQLRMAALNNRAHLVSGDSQVEDAVRLVEEAIVIAERTGYRHREAALRNHLADLHHLAGREREAERALTKAVSLFAGVGSGEWEPEVWLLSRW